MATEDEPPETADAARKRSPALTAAKAVWTIAILGVAVWYVGGRWEEFAGYLSDLGPTVFLVSVVAVTVGRIFLAVISRIALRVFGADIGLVLSFWINAMSQLGKYIPGSVWHLVGRVALYRRHGIPVGRGSAVLVVENLILLVSGACVGVALALGQLGELVGWQTTVPVGAQVAAAVGGIGVWWLLVYVVAPPALRRLRAENELPKAPTFSVGLAFWAAFGIGFWVLLPADARTIEMLPAATAAFAVGWIAGNLAPFAPAGIGVREAAIVALLGPLVGVPVAVGAAASSRIVWTLGEFATAPLAANRLARHRTDARTTQVSKEIS